MIKVTRLGGQLEATNPSIPATYAVLYQPALGWGIERSEIITAT